MPFLKDTFWGNNKLLATILIITVFIFFPVTKAVILGFVDDVGQINENVNVTNFSFQSIKNHFTTYVVYSYQPLASLSFGIEYLFFGLNAFIYHLDNLLLHLINIILVYVLATKLLSEKKRFVAVLITAVFAMHPLQTEPIAWISARSTLLAALFILMTCLYYIKYIENENYSTKYLLLTLFFFLISLFSKSTGIVLPFVLLGIDYLYLRKFNIKAVLDKIPFFSLSIIFGMIALNSRKIIDNSAEILLVEERRMGVYSFIEKIAISCYSFLFYIKKYFFPFNLQSIYGYPLKISKNLLPLEFRIAPFLVLFLFIGLFFWYKNFPKKHKRLFLFGVFFFLVSISLNLNIFAYLAQITAERYMYLANIGISIPLFLFLEKLRATKKGTSIIPIFYIILFTFLAFKSHKQVKVWKNQDHYLTNMFQIFEKNNVTDTSSCWPINELGYSFIQKKEFKKAIECFNRSIKLDKYSPRGYALRGFSNACLGNNKLALKDFNLIIETPKLRTKKPILSEAFRFKGDIYRKANFFKESKTQYDSALYYNPKSIPAKKQLNSLLLELEAKDTQNK